VRRKRWQGGNLLGNLETLKWIGIALVFSGIVLATPYLGAFGLSGGRIGLGIIMCLIGLAMVIAAKFLNKENHDEDVF
jgi:hypothetical protein